MRANEAREAEVQCAVCGERVKLADSACDGCHFIYCVEHADDQAHECTVICVDCPDGFDAWFWSERPALE